MMRWKTLNLSMAWSDIGFAESPALLVEMAGETARAGILSGGWRVHRVEVRRVLPVLVLERIGTSCPVYCPVDLP